MPRFTFPWKKFSFSADPTAPKKSDKPEPARISSSEKDAFKRRSSSVAEEKFVQRTRSTSTTSSTSPETNDTFTRSQSCEEPRQDSSPYRDAKSSHRAKGEKFLAVERREFEVKRTLGEGSFGQVLLATWTSHNNNSSRPQQVALKVLKSEELFDGQLEEAGVAYDDIVAAFEQEIALMELVGRHPYIVEVHAKGTDGRCMALECARSDIYHIVKKVGATLPLPLCEQWARQLLAGIDFIHSQGVIHQDIKSSNILIKADGTAKICDFGLAVKGRARMVVDRELLTLWYRAPELIMGARVYNSSVDEWGAGCIMLEMLLGRVAFAGSASPSCACVCNRVSHANFNRDQLSKVFKVLGTPPDAQTQDLACYRHFQAWPRYKPKLKEMIADAIAVRSLSSSSSSHHQSQISDFLPPSPGAPFRSTASIHSSPPSSFPIPLGFEHAVAPSLSPSSPSSSSPSSSPSAAVKADQVLAHVTAAWTDAISHLLTALPDTRASSLELLQRARLFNPHPSPSKSRAVGALSSSSSSPKLPLDFPPTAAAAGAPSSLLSPPSSSSLLPPPSSSSLPRDSQRRASAAAAASSSSSLEGRPRTTPAHPSSSIQLTDSTPPLAPPKRDQAAGANTNARSHSPTCATDESRGRGHVTATATTSDAKTTAADSWALERWLRDKDKAGAAEGLKGGGRYLGGGVHVGVGHEHNSENPTLEIGH